MFIIDQERQTTIQSNHTKSIFITLALSVGRKGEEINTILSLTEEKLECVCTVVCASSIPWAGVHCGGCVCVGRHWQGCGDIMTMEQ